MPQRPQVDFPILDASGLSASDVTEAIIDNLGSALTGTVPGKWNAAPILRQKIINMTPDKRRSIDRAAISKAAEGALIWSMNATTVEEEEAESKKEKIGTTTGGTVSEQFADWLTDSKEYNDLHEGVKEKVAEETKRFIKQGQEAVLDAGGEEESSK